MYEWLLVFGVVLWLSVGAWYIGRPIASAYHPITYYLIFHGVLFTIRPVLAWWLSFDGIYRAFHFQPSMSDKITVLVAADLAFVVFVAVATWAGDLPFSRASASERGQPAAFDVPLMLTVLLCAPLAIASLATSFQEHSLGTSTMVMTAEGIAVNTSANGYFTDAALMLGPLTALIAWAGRFRPWALVPMAGFVIIKAGTGGRWPFVMTVMSFALFYMYERRLRWPPGRLLFLGAMLITLFTVIGEDRGAGVRRLLGATAANAAPPAEYFSARPLETMDYANMEFFEFIVYVVPQRSGTYDYFLSNLQLFTEPIPRVLWPGKPVGPPIKRFEMTRYGSPIGATPGVAGLGWIEAGWVGLLVWTALFGWGYGVAYNAYVRSDQSRIKTAVFLVLTPICLQTLRDGGLLTVVKTSFYPIVPVALWWLFTRLLCADGNITASPARIA